jgi:hypothetical protein
MTFVTVYSAKIWKPELGISEVWPRMGTRAAIEKLGGKIIEGSVREVPAGDLDEDGFVKPVAAA